MAGMTMAEMGDAGSISQQLVSAPSQAMPAHAVFVDMGACERQSCDQAQALAAKANHRAAAQFDTVLAPAGFSRIGGLQAVFHDARDDLAPFSLVPRSPLSVSLRI